MLDYVRDGVSVRGPESQGLENQHVQSALEKLGWQGFGLFASHVQAPLYTGRTSMGAPFLGGYTHERGTGLGLFLSNW